MTSIVLSFFGPPEQKHVCKVTAMQTLTDALQSISAKFKPALQPDQCELHLNKKPIDMHTPFRLLNVPAGSKLEVIRKAAAEAPATAACALASSTAPAAAAAVAVAAAQASTVAAAAPPAASAAGTQPAPVPQQRQVSFGTDQVAGAAATGATAQDQASASTPSQPPAAAAAAAGGGGGEDSSSPVNPALAALGVTMLVHVFHHRAMEAAAEQAPRAMEVDLPDEFFELTAEDLQRLQHQANEKRKAESVFRTRAAREAEEAARTAALGPVRVRLQFPDGTILQAAFKATDPLGQVQALLHKCADPDLAKALYLFTTPPKTVLKDSAATLHKLQLVPAAHIFVGVDERKLQGKTDVSTSGPFLRAEVLSLMQDTVPDTHPAEEQQQQQGQADAGGSNSGNSAAAVAAAQRALRLAAAASRQDGAGGAAGGASKVPKWFKK